MKTPDWLEKLLKESEVTDICINGADSVYVDRGRGFQFYPIHWSSDSLHNWVLDQLSKVGKTWDARHPFVDAVLPSGHRLHVSFPPISPKTLVSLRNLTRLKAHSKRWSNSGFFDQLKDAALRGETILISGATGSGKTTLLNDLLATLNHRERIIALEDTSELRPPHPHFLSLTARTANADGFGEVTLRELLKQSLRMRPDRIVLGECRGEEVLELLQVINTGHRGVMATIHANSARDAIRRLELLCLLAGRGTLPIQAIRELIAVGIDWSVHVANTAKKSLEIKGNPDPQHTRLLEMAPKRTIDEVYRIEGREGDTILFRPMLKIRGE